MMPSSTHHGIVRALRLAVALAVAGLGLAACGDDDRDAAGTTAPDVEASAPPATDEAILIRTRVNIPTGEVLSGSSIGDSPFCPGGTFRDRHGNDDKRRPRVGGPDLSLPRRQPEDRLHPGRSAGRTQTGPWKVLSGTGAFEGLQGSGQMETKYEGSSDRKGHETFTGTVAR